MQMHLTESQGMTLLRAAIADGKYIFTTEDAIKMAKAQAISLPQLNKIISILTAKEWLFRVRRGLYIITNSLPGEFRTPPFAIATSLVQPSAISHWSAMQFHGLTEQIPQTITASTPKKIVFPSMRKLVSDSRSTKHVWEVANTQYEYITIKPEQFFGIDNVWIDERFCVPITDKERTLLDLFVHSKMFGGMGEALGALEASLSNIDITKLVDYAIKFNKKSVVKRIGWALEYFGISAKYFSKLLEVPIKYYCPLDPSKQTLGLCDSRWMIQNNLKEDIK